MSYLAKYLIALFIVISIHEGFGYKVELRETRWIHSGCECYKYSCGCCAHLEVPKISLNDTGCVNLTYLPNDYGISFTVTIDNLTIYNETISAHNPPPLCFGAPILKEYADLCIKFYNLTISQHKFYGCVELEVRYHEIVVASYKLGCFNIPLYFKPALQQQRPKKNNGTIHIPKITKYMIKKV